MRRAILAGVALGLAAGLLFVYHDALRLTVAWPVILGFALWGAVGREGSRGLMVAIGAAVGVAVGYAAYAVVAELLPVTNLSLGISVGLGVGVLALVGVLAGDRLPLASLLLGFAAFAGLFEPLWAESPANFRSHGLETLTVAILGVLIGALVVTAIRALGDRMPGTAAEASGPAEEGTAPAPPPPANDAVEGRTS
jgi:hypothetical protein